MTIADRGQPVEVQVGECRCPGAPHTQDVVWLKPDADVPMTLAFNTTWQNVEGSALSRTEWEADMGAALAGVYIRHSIVRWTFVDDKGMPVPILPSTITRLLPPNNGGLIVASEADRLYQKDLIDPLREALERTSAAQVASRNRQLRRPTKKSSPRGQTARSTSATNDSGPLPPTPSAPSSPASSAGTR